MGIYIVDVFHLYKQIHNDGRSINLPHSVKQVFWIFSSPFLYTLVCLNSNLCTLHDILSSWSLLWFWILITFVSLRCGLTYPCKLLFYPFQICFLLILYLGIYKHPAKMYSCLRLFDWKSKITGVLHLGQIQKRFSLN